MRLPKPNQAAPHLRFKARKTPRQLRSRSMLETIKQAAHELLAAKDFSNANTSTTHIAARAGISVGSLYQYFPTREAIFLALFEDTTTQMAATMKSVLVQVLNQPLEKGVATVLKRVLSLHREHELIVLKMATQMPELELASQPLSYENMILDAVRVYIAHHCPRLSPRNLDKRTFFVREITMACIYRYLRDPPAKLTERAFVSDLTQIVVPYILKRDV
jgi:AcrR family transcriptional regulator